MRCPDCGKFVSMETGDPETGDTRAEADGSVSVDVRIVRNCADCGTELKGADLCLEGRAELEHKEGCAGEGLEAGDAEATATERTQGKGRYRTFFGAEADVTVTCGCGARATVHVSDEAQASGMDESV